MKTDRRDAGGPYRCLGVSERGYVVAGRVPRTTVSVVVLPSRRTSSFTLSPGADWLVTISSGWVASSAVPLTAVMMSPAWRPPSAAGLPGWTDSPEPSADWVGIHAPVATERPLAFWTVGAIGSRRMPSHGRASG